MATTLASPERSRVIATEREVSQARDVLAQLEGPQGTLVVERVGEAASTMPPEVGRILQQVLDAMARGGTITVTSVPKELTPAGAAEILGISRPTLMKLVKEGRIVSHRVGTHHRLKSEDVFAELKARRARERAAFAALLEAEGDDD